MDANVSSSRPYLAEITDEGRFETLAAAVLRQANPTYRHLIETGTNATGKTVPSPVDGLMLIPGSAPPHFVAFHHTTTAKNKIAEKWLSQDGDLPKTSRWAEKTRTTFPNARIDLVLTTNRTVSPALFLSVQAAAASHGLIADIWDQSRLADHLDNTADGQWLRRSLGVPATRLSGGLLHDLSKKSLQEHPWTLNHDERIPRKLDDDLAQAIRIASDAVFLVAGSGLGKSTAVRALLAAHVEGGGDCLVVPHNEVESAVTLEQAIESTLRKLEPSLSDGCGAVALTLTTKDRPLLLAVEDINQAAQPATLVERLSGWCQAATLSSSAPEETQPPWRLICPLWPQVFDQLREQPRRAVTRRALYGGNFTRQEGASAVLQRAHLAGLAITRIQASEVAASLGNDPLLIALHTPGQSSGPEAVLRDFVEGSLRRAGAASQAVVGLGPSDLRNALFRLASVMLEERELLPRISTVRSWFAYGDPVLKMIDVLASQRELIWRADIGDDEEIVFRHDRVRDYLLSDAVARQMQHESLSDEILSDPFYAEIIGGALSSNRTLDPKWIDRVRAINPLGLFCALKSFRGTAHPMYDAVLSTIKSYLPELSGVNVSIQHLVWAAAANLAEIDSQSVLEIARTLPGWGAVQARFRNGDVTAGASLCYSLDPGVNAQVRDSLIEHVIQQHGPQFLYHLDQLLRTAKSAKHRMGALYLAGHVSDSRLADAIAVAWQTNFNPNEGGELSAFLWAAARCCGDDPQRVLDPICDSWAELPDDKAKDGSLSSRKDIGALTVRLGIARHGLPQPVINYFRTRAESPDLVWPITYMLHSLDHPDVMEHLVQVAGAQFEWSFDHHFCEAWDIHWFRPGRRLSQASLERLYQLWSNSRIESVVRRRAFRLWSGSAGASELPLIRAVEPDSPFYKEALRIRLLLGDTESFAAFKAMLEASDHRSYWWQFGRNVWLPGFTELLESELGRRAKSVRGQNNDAEFDTDWIVAELLQTLTSHVAEEILRQHWDHLKFSSNFVQTALFVSSPLSRELAAQALAESDDPSKLLRYLDHHYRLWEKGLVIANIPRLESLVPYLNLLSESAIESLWEHCNRMGFHGWRRKYLDSRLSGERRKGHGLDEEGLYHSLDKEAEATRPYTRHWIEQFDRRGDPPGSAVRIAAKWLGRRRTLDALKTAADVVISVGRRADLALLEVEGIEPAETARDIVADTRFAVFRRSIN